MKSRDETSLRIRLASLTMLCLFSALAATAYFSGRQVKRNSDLITDDAVPGTIAAHKMRMAMSRSVGWVMVAASAQTKQSRDDSLKIVREADLAFADAINQYQPTITINPAEDRELLERVTSRFADYQRVRMAYEALILAGDLNASATFLEHDLVPAYVAAIRPAEELLAYNHANSILYAKDIRNNVHRLYWAVAVVTVLALICAVVLLVNFAIRRREMEQLKMLKVSVDKHFDAAYWMDASNRFVYVNDTACKVLGYTREELLGQPVTLIAPAATPEVLAEVWKGLRETGFFNRESKHRRKDGSEFPVEVVASYLCFGGKEFNCGFARDITERKLAEQKLRTGEELLRNFIKHTPAAVAMFDTEMRYLQASDRWITDYHLEGNEVIGRSHYEVFPDIPENWKEIHRRALRGQTDRCDEAMFPRAEGGVEWLQWEVRPWHASESVIGGVIMFTQVITERKRLEQKQVELAAIVASSEDAIIGKSLTGIITSWNRGAEKIFGYAASEAIGQPLLMLMPSDRQHEESEILERIGRGETVEHYETVRIRKDRRRICISATISPLKDGQGKVIGASKIARDITEQKQAREELIWKTALLEAQVDSTLDGVMVVDTTGKRILQNRRFLEMFKVPEAIARDGDHTKMLLHAVNQVKAPQQFRERIAYLYEHPDEIGRDEIELADGQVFDRFSGPVRDKGGRHFGRIWTFRDITERKKAEEALRESDERYKSIISVSNTGAWEYHADSAYIWCSREYFSMLGRSHADYDMSGNKNLKEAWSDLLHPDDREPAANRFAEYLKNGSIGTYENYFRLQHQDGSWVWIWSRGQTLRDAQGKVTNLTVGTHIDITEQRKAEEETRATNARYARQEAALMELTRACALRQSGIADLRCEVTRIAAQTLAVERVGIWRYERDHQGIVCQDLFEQSTRSHSGGKVFRIGDIPAYFRALAEGDIIVAHDAYRDPRTTELSETYLRPLGISSLLNAPIHVTGKVEGGVCCEHVGPARQWTADEQTFIIAIANLFSLLLAEEERKQIEEQLRQTQKMEAIGTLAGGIAHDFNNILTAMNGYTEMALWQVPDDPVASEYLNAVLQGGTRAAALVRQILAFSRQQEQKCQPVQLRPVVAEPLTLLRASVPSTIEFDISLAADLPAVLADATQIHQIVMNLCTNAAHAMKDHPGRLGVRLENFAVDAAMAGANPGLRPGPYVRLSISDTGHGMDAATKARIFEPFFTTKKPGEGTGLGLSVVHGIMQSYGGLITVYSQPGEGTVFHLYFPITAVAAQERGADASAIPTGQGERILFVDDEMPLALLGQCMLTELGYVVEAKSNVVEALDLMRTNPGAFDLVITDLTMPGMSGTNFARQLLLLRPDLPIILTTGYTASLTEQRLREQGVRELLPKPHTLRSLGMAVHRVLHTQSKS